MTCKIVHTSSVHPAFDVRIFEKECRTLAAAGYEVVFVVPHGKDEMRDGVQIRAVELPRKRLERFTSTIWRVYRAALRENAAIYHFHDPELMPIGLLLKLHGKRVIYDVHENYRKTLLSKQWLPSPVRRAASFGVAAMENLTGALCDRVVPAVPSIARLFPAGKTTTIHNFPHTRVMQAPGMPDDMAMGERKRGRIVYVGGISFARGIGTMIDAMTRIPEVLGPELVVAGEFPPALRDELSTKPGWDRVVALGRQSRGQVLELLGGAQVGLCVLHSTPNHIDSYPIKLFEYMACGLPVVASDFALWREFVRDSNCGLLVDPMNPASIAEAITWILEHPEEAEQMGRNGQRAVIEKYNWEAESWNLVEMYRKLIETR